MAPPSKYTPEFREEAVQIALRSSKTISETAREMDLNPETLRGWVKRYKKRNEPPADAELTLSERARLKQLERRIREVEMENVFLKKAAANSTGRRNALITEVRDGR
ncbi:transposase [Streptomyces sp. NPDC127051]|uniref:transposase n=1 Tax=Streptomyces sp. NPDC127051 TaxID=3347119 RepID=UPI0036685533